MGCPVASKSVGPFFAGGRVSQRPGTEVPPGDGPQALHWSLYKERWNLVHSSGVRGTQAVCGRMCTGLCPSWGRGTNVGLQLEGMGL